MNSKFFYRVLFSILILIILPVNVFAGSYLTTADNIRSTRGNVQLDLDSLISGSADTTAEILAIKLNLSTQEAYLNSLRLNITTHETLLSDLHLNISTLENITNEKIDAIDINLGTQEIYLNDLKSNIDTHESWLTSLQNRIASLEVIFTGGSTGEVLTRTITGFIWATIPSGVTDHTLLSNIGTLTHNQIDSAIAALQANPGGITKIYGGSTDFTGVTGEVGIVAGNNISVTRTGGTIEIESTGASVTPKAVKSTCLYYGFPVAINDLWDDTLAAEFYSKYDIIVFGDEYQQTSHETHVSMVNIISKVKVLNPDVEIFGYVPIGGSLGRNLSTAEIETGIQEWKDSGATGVFLDEFGFDYMVTRERQNIAVDKAHSLSMNVIANAWTIDHVFNNDNGYCDWIPFYGNPNFVEAHINSNDYYLFENMFYYYDTSQKVQDQWRVYEAYRYYYDSYPQSTYGVNYYDTFHTKTIALDAIDTGYSDREKAYMNGMLGSRLLNIDAYCASVTNWGADSTLYPSYSMSMFLEENRIFEITTKIKPIPQTYSGKDVAKYDTTIENNLVTLYWTPGATVSNPALGTHKVQLNSIDRTNAYTPSASASTNIIGNLVRRDMSGNFSAGTVTATLNGNAGTATKLATPRNINGVAFDGSADITLPVPAAGITKVYGDSDSTGSSTGEITIKGDGSSTQVTRTGQTFEVRLIGATPSSDAISNIYGGISDVSGTGTGEVSFYGSGAVEITRAGKTIEIYAPASSSSTAGISKLYGGTSDVSGVTGEVTIKAGTNVTVTRTDGTIEIAATGGSSEEEDASNMYQATLTDSYATLFTVGSTSRMLQLHIANTGASTRIAYLKFNNAVFLQKTLEPYQSITVTDSRFLIHTSYDNKITGKQDSGNDVVVTAYTVANTTDIYVGGVETNGTSYSAFVTASGNNKKIKEIWMVNTYSSQIICNISTTNSPAGTIFKNIVIPANSFVVLQKLNMIVTDGNSLYWNSDTQVADRNILAIGKTQ